MLPCHLRLLIILLSWFGILHGFPSTPSEIVTLQTMEAELEMCFIRKVKNYCDSKVIQKDSAAPNSLTSQPVETRAQKQIGLTYVEDLLYEQLFSNYHKHLITKLPGGGPVQVQVGFTLIQLNTLDEKSQILTTSGWMEVTWRDVRLAWNNITQFKHIPNIVTTAASVWLPDMALQNSATDIYHASLVDDKFRVNIYPDGTLLWVPGGKFFTNCELDISYFPFDDQTCYLHFTNWAYNGDEMNLTTKDTHIGLENYQVNGEWDIVYTAARREDKYYACCGNTPYPSIYFTLYMRRKFLFYITNIIAPCVMLSLLVCLVFYLPPEAGEKIPLGVTILLSFTVFLLLIAESIPKRSDSVPIISIYLATFLAITTMSIIATVIVLHVHHMGTRRVPKILKRIMFDIMARALFMNELAKKYGTSSCSQNSESTPLQSSLNSVYLTTTRNPTLIRDGKAFRHSPKEQRRLLHNGRVTTGMKKSLSETEDQIAQQVLVQRNYVLEEILINIKALIAERSCNEHDESRKQEWIAVAQVLDRFFMVAFILSISISSLIILVVMPNNKVSQFQQ